MNPVPCEPTGSRFSAPGFTPGSLPVLLAIPGPTQSHSIPIFTDHPFQAKTEPFDQVSPRVRRPSLIAYQRAGGLAVQIQQPSRLATEKLPNFKK